MHTKKHNKQTQYNKRASHEEQYIKKLPPNNLYDEHTKIFIKIPLTSDEAFSSLLPHGTALSPFFVHYILRATVTFF